MRIRPLEAQDELQLEEFLHPRRDSSMFLRANASRAGLDHSGQTPRQIFVGAFQDGEIVGVAGQGASGMLLIQAPGSAADLARACVDLSQRPVTGLAGPPPQVEQARTALRLNEEDASYKRDEWLYGLDLCDLTVPIALSTGLGGVPSFIQATAPRTLGV